MSGPAFLFHGHPIALESLSTVGRPVIRRRLDPREVADEIARLAMAVAPEGYTEGDVAGLVARAIADDEAAGR